MELNIFSNLSSFYIDRRETLKTAEVNPNIPDFPYDLKSGCNPSDALQLPDSSISVSLLSQSQEKENVDPGKMIAQKCVKFEMVVMESNSEDDEEAIQFKGSGSELPEEPIDSSTSSDSDSEESSEDENDSNSEDENCCNLSSDDDDDFIVFAEPDPIVEECPKSRKCAVAFEIEMGGDKKTTNIKNLTDSSSLSDATFDIAELTPAFMQPPEVMPPFQNSQNTKKCEYGVPKRISELIWSDEEEDDDYGGGDNDGPKDSLDDADDPMPDAETSELSVREQMLQNIQKWNEALALRRMQTELDKSTEETSDSVDPKTDKILKRYFDDVCPEYLDNKCMKRKCKKSHKFVDVDSLYIDLQQASRDAICDDIIPVLLRFYKLFLVFVETIVRKCVHNNYDEALIELVKGCHRHPSTKHCLRLIARKGIDLDYWNVHQALEFILEHHIDSPIARTTIYQMILDSGSCMPYFMKYIEFYYKKQTITDQDFGRILYACVNYRTPCFPNFCLNYLLQCSTERLNQFHKDNLKAFLRMSQCTSGLKKHRKLISLLGE